MRRNKSEKVNIAVRDENGNFVEMIRRKIWAESIGNFNPIFCRYKGKRFLVKSESQDMSDPFRRKESNDYFIEIEREV